MTVKDGAMVRFSAMSCTELAQYLDRNAARMTLPEKADLLKYLAKCADAEIMKGGAKKSPSKKKTKK